MVFLLFHSHPLDLLGAGGDVGGPVGVVDHQSRLAARRLFDMTGKGVIDSGILLTRRLGIIGRDLGRLGEIPLPRLFSMADHHHVRARLTLDMEPIIGLFGQLVGDIFVLHVVLAAQHGVTAVGDKACHRRCCLLVLGIALHAGGVTRAVELIADLGKIRRVSFEYCQYSSRYDRYKGGEVLNAFEPKVSGGALFDIGIYPLFWCVALFGKPMRVFAKSVFLENGFEGSGCLLLDYDGFTASVTYSKICDSVIPSVITGEDGSLVIHKMQSPEKLVFVPRKGDATVLDYTPAENNLVYEVRDFVAAIQSGCGGVFDAFTRDLYETLDLAVQAAGIK